MKIVRSIWGFFWWSAKQEYDLTAALPAESISDELKGYIIEAYRKHTAELSSIEDRLNKLLLVMLGLFAAAVSAVQKTEGLTGRSAAVLILVVVAFTLIGLHYNFEMQALRGSVRHLLIRCEIAMRFYDTGRFLKGQALYTEIERAYANKGRYLATIYAACIYAAASGLILVIWLKLKSG